MEQDPLALGVDDLVALHGERGQPSVALGRAALNHLRILGERAVLGRRVVPASGWGVGAGRGRAVGAEHAGLAREAGGGILRRNLAV